MTKYDVTFTVRYVALIEANDENEARDLAKNFDVNDSYCAEDERIDREIVTVELDDEEIDPTLDDVELACEKLVQLGLAEKRINARGVAEYRADPETMPEEVAATLARWEAEGAIRVKIGDPPPATDPDAGKPN